MVAKEGVWVWSDLDGLQTRTGNALYNGEEEDRDMWLWLLRKLFVPRKYFWGIMRELRIWGFKAKERSTEWDI